MINIKNDVPFAHIKIPGDHGGGIHNLNENLEKRDPVINKSAAQGLATAGAGMGSLQGLYGSYV